MLGTALYASPEQASGERALDGRSDLSSPGCVLFEMLAGEPPFAGGSVPALIARHLTTAPPSPRLIRPSVPDWLDRVVQRALAKGPADRFADATASRIADALQLVLGVEGESRKTPAPTRNLEAYDLYLLGRQLFHQLRRKSCGEARTCFGSRWRLDPSFARAWAGIADASSLLSTTFDADAANARDAEQASAPGRCSSIPS